MSKEQKARALFVNHAASILEGIATRLRAGVDPVGYSAAAAQRIAELATPLLCAHRLLLPTDTDEKCSEFATVIYNAGPLPKGVRQAFADLTGWEFPVNHEGCSCKVKVLVQA